MRAVITRCFEDDYTLRPREQRGQRGRRANGRRARVCADALVRQHGRHLSNSPAIKRIERGLNRDGSAWNLAGAVAAARAGLARGDVITLRRMLYLLAAGDAPLLGDAEVVFGLGRLAERRGQWLRRFEDWRPPAGDARDQFRTLTRFLLCRYSVPRPFDEAWLGTSALAHAGRRWFVHVGLGGSLRTAPDLPYPLSRQAAHHVIRAPAGLTLAQALRWGQFVALGAPEHLARAAVESRLANTAADPGLCASFARFLAREAAMGAHRVGPILDYVLADRDGREPLAARPARVFDDRSFAGIEREMREWHAALRRNVRSGGYNVPTRWRPSGIRGFDEIVEHRGAVAHWTAVELTEGEAVLEEGRAMHHCVTSYAGRAATGHVALFSLRRDTGDGMERCLTIEVQLGGEPRVVQARGACNRRPTEPEAAALAAWAKQAGILVPKGAVL